MQNLIKTSFYLSISLCIIAIITIIGTYIFVKPSLPEINLVDESELQMPMKVFTKDGQLIGEFGEIKRRATDYDDIPINIKNAFLAAEDDNFFYHQGISYKGLIRSFIRCLSANGCEGGGGTITMQVVRGYLLTRDQTVIRKIKEIYLALELEGNITKEEIFELYVNRIFLGNRSYGIEAAANTYFDKGLDDLNISESATIAALAQLPSRVNPVKDPRRTIQRRNWILSRMLSLSYINSDQYEEILELNETLLHSASKFKDFYPENSQAEGASDNIWSDRETFNEYNQNFVDDIEMISLSIELEDKEMISDAIKAMAANCSTCHKKFRN